ncbi:hypothetical protein MLD38_023703 [Melastoma candidum]|uniref:Uncharacterized protein n=1 Tax=Melastoma candidum TaxID=119954 RepID=A0ACB9NRL6_9MYRT|nr:hypothetical protein MLD38_023703 [Melastoma candidum]
MDLSTGLLIVSTAAAYLLWFRFISQALTGPRVWPLLGSLPGLIRNANNMHEWIADNLRACSGTYQTCICPVPFLVRKQGLVTVTCDPRNLEHILKAKFGGCSRGGLPHWSSQPGDGSVGQPCDQTQVLSLTGDCSGRGDARRPPGSLASTDIRQHLRADLWEGYADPCPGLPENAFTTSFDRATEATLQRFILPEFIWKVRKLLGLGMEVSLTRSLAHFDGYLSEIINTRKHELASQQQQVGGVSPHDDLLSRFMKKKESYSEEFLQHVVLNFILASRDTSSVVLTWFFWLVSRTPRVEEKILLNICEVLLETRGSDTTKWLDDPLGFEEVDRLTYLKAALTETLRLYHSVPEDSKHVVADDVLPSGVFVLAGSAINYSINSVGRMEFIWGPDCLEFKPERCLLRHGLTVAQEHRVVQKMSLTLFIKYGLMVDVHPRDLRPILGKLI